jgi:hypothetical protein
MLLLRQCLLDTYLVRLRTIARFWQVELTTSKQREAALELAEAMINPESLSRAYRALSEQQRQALRALLASDGQMPHRVYAREWGKIRTMGPGRMDRERPWEEPISPAEGLWYRGFLFRNFEQGPDGAYEAVFVPPEIRAQLPTPDEEKLDIALEPAPAPANVHPSGDFLVDDACTLLSYVQNERPRLVSNYRWSKRHRQRLLRRLRIQNPDRLAFLGHIAHSVGWVFENGTGHLRLQPEPVTAWLEATTFDQRCAMAETWREDATWNDLFHVSSLQPEDTGAWRNDPVLARNAILCHLKSCTPETWYRLEDFASAVKQVDPDFQRPGGDYETWYIRDAETGAYLSGFESWDDVEGRLIRYLIVRPLTWLGIVDLGDYEGSKRPFAFRLTEGGAAFLDLANPPPPVEPSAPRLRSGFRVSMPAARRYERFQLARVADWVAAGDCFTYRLTPDSLERARKQGISVKRVIEFLDEVTDGPLPRSVEAAMTRWDARGTEAGLERSILLRLTSEELMNRAMSSRRISQLIKERIGPTTALVSERDWPQVAAGLEEMGLLPQIVGLHRSEGRQS